MASLNNSLNTCKVDVGWANRYESDRFQDSDSMVCPTWNGVDKYGRHVIQDSAATKSRGCNLASDRVAVENNLRHSYAEGNSLDSTGISASYFEHETPDICNLTTNDMAIISENNRTIARLQNGIQSMVFKDLSGMT